MPATFSFGVLFTLLVILLASGAAFYVLTRQWTTHRPVESLREWADERDFKLQLGPDIALPAALQQSATLNPQIELMLTCGRIVLIRLSTTARPASPRPVWNLLIQESTAAQNPAGLRPASASTSFLDLFSLNGFPSLLPPERFVAFAGDSRDAKRMAASPARGLLPADIGLLVHGPYITLDFSARPFDPIEFDRMLAIIKQLTR
jgi:hypothetical protein